MTFAVRRAFARLPADTTPFDITIAGITMTPVAVMTDVSGAITEQQNDQNDCARFHGLSDFVTRAGYCGRTSVAASSPSARGGHQTGLDLAIYTGTAMTLQRSAMYTPIEGGIRVTPQQSGDQYYFQVMLFFDCEVTIYNDEFALNQNSNIVIPHGLPGAPNAGIWISGQRFNELSGSHWNTSHGFHSYNAPGPAANVNLHTRYRSTNMPAETYTNISSAYVVTHLLNGSSIWEALELTGIDDTNITLTARLNNWSTRGFLALWIYAPEARTHVDILQTPIDDTVDWNVTGVGFEPQAAITAISTRLGTGGSSNQGNCHGISVYSRNGAGAQASVGSVSTIQTSNQDGATGNVEAYSRASQRFERLINAGGVITNEMINPQFNADGFTIAAEDVLSVSTSIRFWPTIFFEHLEMEPPVPPINRPPYAIATPTAQEVEVGVPMTPFDASPFFTDPDGDALTFDEANFPNGINIDAAGIVSGTPTGGFDGTAFPPDVVLVWDTPIDAPDGIQGEAYAYWIGQHVNNASMVDFAIISGSLPPGLTMDVRGNITGTPTATGSYQGIIAGAANRTSSAQSLAFDINIFTHSLVSGEQPGGAVTGFVLGQFGAITPDTAFGITITEFQTSESTQEVYRLVIEGVASANEDAWSQIEITGLFASGQKTIVWDRVADGFTYDSDFLGNTRWERNEILGFGLERFVDGETYQINII